MKYLKFSPIVLALAFLLYYYFGVYVPQGRVLLPVDRIEQPTAAEPKQMELKQWETKIDDQPPVAVEVTPVELGQAAGQWKFAVTFTTHSGSLDEDLLTVASLADDKGNVYRPIFWEGPGPGGHHREGILIFNPIEPTPKYVELKIKNVGGVVERFFRWNTE